MQERLIPNSRVRLTLLALLFASIVSTLMLVARAVVAKDLHFAFLPYNLVLAWIPLLLSLRVYTLYARRSPRFWLLAAVALAWFFFFPNAPYIVTDLVHLKTRAPIPRWFDMIMMMSFAWTGFFLGYLSLYQMQEVVRAWRGRHTSWYFVLGMLALSSFGIYLGRFLRWNSWDVLFQPVGLARDLVKSFHLTSQPEMIAFSLSFFAFSLTSYLTLFALTHLHGWVPREPRELDGPAAEKAVAAAQLLR